MKKSDREPNIEEATKDAIEQYKDGIISTDEYNEQLNRARRQWKEWSIRNK